LKFSEIVLVNVLLTESFFFPNFIQSSFKMQVKNMVHFFQTILSLKAIISMNFIFLKILSRLNYS